MVGRCIAGGAVTFPNGVRLVGFIRSEHVRQKVLGGSVGFFEKPVFFEGFRAHISRRQPNSTAPVISVGERKCRIVSGDRHPGAFSAEDSGILDVLTHSLRLFGRANLCQHRPVGGGGLHFERLVGFGIQIVINAIFRIPIQRVDRLFQLLVLFLPFGGNLRASTGIGQSTDVERGERLLRNGVNPETAAFARRIVHAALNTVPKIAVFYLLEGCRCALFVLRSRRLHFPAGLHLVEPLEMLLEVLCFRQQFDDMVAVAGNGVVVILDPGKQRRIIRMLNIQGISPVVIAFVMKRNIEVIQAFHAGELVRSILAEQRHEAGVPDPDRIVPERFVDIGRLWETRLRFDFLMCNLPRFPIQLNIARLFLKYRNGHRCSPVGTLSRLQKREGCKETQGHDH